MKEQGIEEIFKSAFNNFEADVDPNVWTNVQSRIGGTPAAHPHHGANGSVAGKAGAVATKLGVKAIIAIVTAVTGVTVGTYFLLKEPQNKKAAPSTSQFEQPAAQAITRQSAPATSEQSHSSASGTPALIKANVPIAQQKVNEEKNQIVSSAANTQQAQPSPSANPATPAKDVPVVSPAHASQAAPSKQEPQATTPPQTTAHENVAQPPAEASAPENHAFQNDFADINDYIENEASETKGLPNAFSPNGDGHNDLFKINTKNLKSIIVLIYDRSGKQIYEWNDLGGEWNGNLADGHPAPTGIYYYSVQAETMDGKTCIGNSTLKLTR